MNQETIAKIRNDDIVQLQETGVRLERELSEINLEIPRLRAALDGQSDTPEAYQDYEKTRRLLDSKLSRAFELRKIIAKSKETLDSVVRKWATSVAKEHPKRIMSARVLAADHLESISKVLVGEKDYHGPSILSRYLRVRDVSRESHELHRELGLAHEILDSGSVSTPCVPSLPPWEKFREIITRSPVSWNGWLGDHWLSDIVSSDVRKRIEDETKELPYRTDPEKREREEAFRELTDEMDRERDRKRRERDSMSLQEKAEKGLLTDAELLMISVARDRREWA